MNDKLIVVAGGAGKLGRLLVGALLEHPSVRVRVLVRDPGKPEVASLGRDRVELKGLRRRDGERWGAR